MIWSYRPNTNGAALNPAIASVGIKIYLIPISIAGASVFCVYDTQTNLWTYETSIAGTANTFYSATSHESIIYIAGGNKVDFRAYDTVSKMVSVKNPAPMAINTDVSLMLDGVVYVLEKTTGTGKFLAFSIYGDKHPANTAVIQYGLTKNKSRICSDNPDMILYLENCYHHDGIRLRRVNAAVNIDNAGWTNMV